MAESDPLRGVRFVAHQIVPFRPESHRQHIIGEPCGLAPRWRQRGVAADQTFIRQNFHPRCAIGVRPNGIVDARKVGIELPAPLFQEMRQEKTHFEKGEWVFLGHQQLVPHFLRRRLERRIRDELVIPIRRRPAWRRDRADEHVQKLQAARDLPPAQVARRRAAPDVRRKRRTRAPNLACDLDNRLRRNARFLFRERGRELRVMLLQPRDEIVEIGWLGG